MAVELKFIDAAQLKQALDAQVDDDLSGKPHRVIGAICFAQGWMTPEQINIVLNAMFRKRSERIRPEVEAKQSSEQ